MSARHGCSPQSAATLCWSWPPLAICAITAAQLTARTDTQAPPPVHPDQAPPDDPGMIPLTVPESDTCSPPPTNSRIPPATPHTG
ncbi:MAG: hypothetical protein JWO67_5356 [Streptosporangiaceae bacterium]|nr:hypothetical protein [Streptosporangiaceae bacterium]